MNNRENMSLASKLVELHDQCQLLDESTFILFGLKTLCHLTASNLAYLHFVHPHDASETEQTTAWLDLLNEDCTSIKCQPNIMNSASLWFQSFQDKRSLLNNHYHQNISIDANTPCQRFITRHAVTPVVMKDKVIAIIGVCNKESDYHEFDLDLLQLLANELWKSIAFRRTQLKLTAQHQQLLDLLNATGEGIIGINTTGMIHFANPAALSILGYDNISEIIDKSLLTVFYRHPLTSAHQDSLNRNNTQSILQCKTFELAEDIILKKDDSPIYVNNRSYPIFDNQQVCTGAIIIFKDISSDKAKNDYLRLTEAVLQVTNEGILITNTQGIIEHANPKVTEITGYSHDELIGSTPKLFSSGRHDDEFYLDMWETIASTGHWQGEIWNRRKNGEVYPELLSISTLKDQHQQPIHYIAVFIDITKFKAKDEQIRFLATHDALTKLPNRMAIGDIFTQLASLSQLSKTELAVLFIDLDRFKIVNDTLGHHVGDHLLVQVAKRLKSTVREQDVISRLGGDEFLVLLPEITHARKAQQIAENIIDALTEPFMIDGHRIMIGGSIGVSMFPQHAKSFNALLHHADNAMYFSKSNGRNRVSFFNESMHQSSIRRQKIEQALRHAILHKQEFTLLYQPQVNRKGDVVAVEALLRWHSCELGDVMPCEFIPIAEETGLIINIGDWVINQCCQQLHHWNQAGIFLERLSINVSLSQLHQADFYPKLKHNILKFGLNPTQIMLEFSETQLAAKISYLTTHIKHLHKLGIQLAVDDFGTGYSNLGTLRALKVVLLKVDRSFIKNMTQSEDDKAIVEAMLHMANSLNIRVLAEGIETPEQLSLLEAFSCDLYQGFHFYNPMSTDAVQLLLCQHRNTEIMSTRAIENLIHP